MVYDTPLENVEWARRPRRGRISAERALYLIEIERTWIRWTRILLKKHGEIFQKLKEAKAKKVKKILNELFARFVAARMNAINAE